MDERPVPEEVEVERLPRSGSDDPGAEAAGPGARLERALGPVAAGVWLDVVDVLTPGALGLWLGPLLGGPAGYYLARRVGLDRRRALLVGGLAALYCAVPLTSPVPLATLVGAWARFRGAPGDRRGT